MQALSDRVSAMPAPHDAALIFPMMSDSQLKELAEDIGKNGQRDPIVLFEGKILDGRNRWSACILAGIEPKTIEWNSSGDPIDWVISKNLHRRQLDAAQRAAVAVSIIAIYETRARAAATAGHIEGGKKAGNGRSSSTVSPTVKQQSRDQRTAVSQAARAASAGVSATRTLKAVKEKAPDVFALAAAGKIKVTEASRMAALPSAARDKIVDQVSRGERPNFPKSKSKLEGSPASIVSKWRSSIANRTPREKGEFLHWIKNWAASLAKEIA
jgi:hypothetical protein